MRQSILITEDSAAIRELVKNKMEQEGYEVLVAKDSKEAVSLINDQSIDLIISNLNLPSSTGIDLVKAVRLTEKYKFTPFLMVASDIQADQKVEARKAGATGWITEDNIEEQLVKSVKKVLR